MTTEKAPKTEDKKAPKEDLSEMTEEQKAAEKQKAEQAEMRRTLNEAKAVLYKFAETPEYKALPEEVQNAIKRMMKKASSSGSTATTQGFLEDMFPKAGATIDEFELFKNTRMGRGEMQKKVHYAMRRADKDNKLWIRFDPKLGEGSWILDAVGGDMPKGWTEDMLPQTREAK